jgi:superfamily II DNA or RNA helicase/HKD family nuclease
MHRAWSRRGIRQNAGMPTGPDLGLYEALIDQVLAHRLTANVPGLVAQRAVVDEADLPLILADHVGKHLAQALLALPADGRRAQQLAVVNDLVARIQALAPEAFLGDAGVPEPGEWLHGLGSATRPVPPRPQTPLSGSTLLTGSPGEPALGQELAAELASCDAVDLIVSFIKWHGFRQLRDAFHDLVARGGRIRVLSTTYMGASDAEALEALARLPTAELRVSYDTRRTRLHAKAWCFHRATGFGTIYVGSANVSVAALGSGLEWTLKATQHDAPHLVHAFQATFDRLWEDGEFRRFNPDDAQDRAHLTDSLDRARGKVTVAVREYDLRPYDFQERILDVLAAARAGGHRRNLVVAATGTGKTMIAAFDFRRLCQPGQPRPRLLFLAHRHELLEQARATFRDVLRDQDFGEILDGSSTPSRYDHCFATIQTVHRRDLPAQIGATFWHLVVLDECHHIEATTYRSVLDRLTPDLLLGLTATPERADGLDILPWFEGRTTCEIRLWEALSQQLLVPFTYYGVKDSVDLDHVAWVRGSYDLGELARLYDGNTHRAALVLEQFHSHYGEERKARALGFCVSKEHARFMAAFFTEHDVPAQAVLGDSDTEERRTARERLRVGELQVLFTCDLYNEGVDLPFVDCLLLLRPTESVTLFLQQLGRGLRLHDGKATCLVLDFIGRANRKFRFDLRLSALTGLRRVELRHALEQQAVRLPPGCGFHLQREAREVVLENLREHLDANMRRLERELQDQTREGAPVTLAGFLDRSGFAIGDLYRRCGWTTLKRRAGLLPALPSEDADEEAQWSRNIERLLHIDDDLRLDAIRRLVLDGQVPRDEGDRRLLRAFAARWATKPRGQLAAAVIQDRLCRFPDLRQELADAVEVLAAKRQMAAPDRRWTGGEPLAVHAHYERDEILCLLGNWTDERQPPWREGVRFLEATRTDIFVVTLEKAEHRFSPQVRYQDYVINRELFHWQSQNATGPDSPTGQRYVTGLADGQLARHLLFVRRSHQDAFQFLGSLTHVSSQCAKPMSITWRVNPAMPMDLVEGQGATG